MRNGAANSGLDFEQAPPEQLKKLFKKHQKANGDDLNDDASIIDFRSVFKDTRVDVEEVGTIPSTKISLALKYLYEDAASNHELSPSDQRSPLIYMVQGLSGLFIIPQLLCPSMQIHLLDRLLHRDLVDPKHKTNLHLHYDMSYNALTTESDGRTRQHQAQSKQEMQQAAEHSQVVKQLHEQQAQQQTRQALPWTQSLFCADLSSTFPPKDPSVHEELSLARALDKKLRWLTIGGQYDWTAKAYPEGLPPAFPSDIAGMLKTLFPDVDPQAAILNIYSPGNTLGIHQDVSEKCDRDLISLSFGCDAIFVAGNQDGSQTATMRLRSGDALVMSKASRLAWHGVPKVLAGTCPEWLEDWPVVGENRSTFRQWKGWMAGKRINLNVRQMTDSGTGGLSSPA